MTNNHRKSCSIWYFIRELKIKMKIRCHCIPIRVAKIQNWEQQMLTRRWSNRNSHLLLVGMQNGLGTRKNSLAVSYTTKHTLSIWSSTHAPWNLHKVIENLCLHKNLQTDVDRSFILTGKTCKQTRCPSAGGWINYGPSKQCNITQHYKEMSYPAMKRHDGTLNACY